MNRVVGRALPRRPGLRWSGRLTPPGASLKRHRQPRLHMIRTGLSDGCGSICASSRRATRRWRSMLAAISARAVVRHLRQHGIIGDRRIAQPPRRVERIARAQFARIDGPLRQQPGDDVHQPSRHLQQLAREGHSPERVERFAFDPARLGRNSRAPRRRAASHRHKACRSFGDGFAHW